MATMPISINPRVYKKLEDIELLLDCNNAILGVQKWAIDKYGGEKCLRLIKEYIREIRKLLA